MQNRRVLPPLFKAKEDPDRREDKLDEAKDTAAEAAATRKPDDPTEDGVDKSFTADEVCVAQLLKGRPNASELFDMLKALDPGQIAKRNATPGALSSKNNAQTEEQKAANPLINRKPNPELIAKLTKKSEGTEDEDDSAREDEDTEKSYSLDFSKSILDKLGLTKAKKTNESGEEFQDGSEDTIGAEGHAAPARAIAHEGGGTGPDHPGTKTKKASQGEGDLQKSDNLTDNKPEEFKDEMEEDDTIPSEGKEAEKSFTYDEAMAASLLKSHPFAQEIIDLLNKAAGDRGEEAAKDYKFNKWHKRAEARGTKMRSGIEATKRAVSHFKGKADLDDEITGRKAYDGREEAEKSEDPEDFQKGVSYRRGTQSPTKGAAGRHFAREAREEQKAEDTKHRIERPSVLGSGGEVTNVSDKVVRVRPHKAATVGDEAKITRSIHTELDAILKARRPSWDPKPKAAEDADKEAFHAGALSGDPGSREHEYKRKQELADKWQAKKNSPEFRAASKMKDADEGDD